VVTKMLDFLGYPVAIRTRSECITILLRWRKHKCSVDSSLTASRDPHTIFPHVANNLWSICLRPINCLPLLLLVFSRMKSLQIWLSAVLFSNSPTPENNGSKFPFAGMWTTRYPSRTSQLPSPKVSFQYQLYPIRRPYWPPRQPIILSPS
jgi:hypothetical protein